MKNLPTPFSRIAILLSTASLTACGAGSVMERANSLSGRLNEPVGCSTNAVRDGFFKALYDEVAMTNELPPPDFMREGLANSPTPKSSALRAEQPLSDAYANFYAEIYVAAETPEHQKLEGEARKQALLTTLAEIELGDRTTPEKAAIQSRIAKSFRDFEVENEKPSVIAHNASDCIPTSPDQSTPTTPAAPNAPSTPVIVDARADSVPLFEKFRKNFVSPVYGAYKVLSVAYQSCSVLDIAPMTNNSRRMEGIVIDGTHPSGGYQRTIASATSVMKSNAYYSTRTGPAGSCFPEQKNPLIYDFGGKPYVASTSAMEIDLFKNGGSGSVALGIDCSGYVSSALLVSGLKLKKEASSKAYQIGGVNSYMLMDPENNGLSCISRQKSISNGATLNPGDIIAQAGHVVMVDQVGTDPFGIARITRAVDCTAAQLPSSRFNFTITQSSASLGGIGLNRFKISDFLAGDSSMRNGMVQYAVAHCKAKFGITSTIPVTNPAAIVRHLGTAQCQDTKVTVKYSSCMNSCR